LISKKVLIIREPDTVDQTSASSIEDTMTSLCYFKNNAAEVN